MPVQVSYPGVYIEEIPSSPTTVTAATTSATAFGDFFVRGPMGKAQMVTSFSDFQRTFGGLNQRSEASYAIMQYFDNGGQTAWVVRLGDGSANAASFSLDVTLPSASSLSAQAAQAAASAQSAADDAQKAMSQPVASDAASKAAAAATSAAQFTLQAASATQALSEELNQDIEVFNATYGSEAGATRDAAQDAADAAHEAAVAAQVAADAASAAVTAANNLTTEPVNNALALASTDAATGAVAGATQLKTAAAANLTTATTGQNPPLTKTETQAVRKAMSSGDYSTATVAATGAAASAYTPAKQALIDLNAALVDPNNAAIVAALKTLVQPFAAMANAAASLLLAANDTTGFATQAATDSGTAAGASPTVSVETVSNEITAAASAAKSSSAQASVLASAQAAALSALKSSGISLTAAPGQGLQTDLTSTGTAIPATTQAAAAASGWAQWCQSAVANWIAATHEDDNLSDSGAAAAATTAQGNATNAAKGGTTLSTTATTAELGALFPTQGQDLPTLINFLNGAAAVLASAASGGPTDLTSTVANLKTTATAAKAALTAAAASTGNPAAPISASTQALVYPFAAAAEAAYLSTVITQDLFTGVNPLDTAQSAALQAATAAQDAALKAAIAAAKARQAELAAEADAAAGQNVLLISAANPGTWGNNLQVTVTLRPGYLFDLQVQEMAVRNGQLKAISTETYSKLSLGNPTASNYAPAVVNDESALIQLSYTGLTLPGASPIATQGAAKLTGGSNGNPPRASDLFPALANALLDIAPNTFNILCLPIIATYSTNEATSAITDAMNCAAANHAFYIVDIPQSVSSPSKMSSWMQSYGNASAVNSAVYYPRLLMPDPLQNYRLRNVGASGAMAGIYARNDLAYGVWTTPAGINATLSGSQPASTMTDADNGQLNPLGINCLRTFPVYGSVVWGGRTMAGADEIGSQWKYLSVRRLADYIEQSLLASLRWVVFQNNDSRLWSQIRSQVGSFMSGLYAAGAFAGGSPTSAYLVKCDSSTTTQTDIDNGIVNILVGFAPEKPAEFVIVQIEQLAGQTAS